MMAVSMLKDPFTVDPDKWTPLHTKLIKRAASYPEVDRIFVIIEPGDIDEALNAASAIGDDRIQRQTQGYVIPDSFTHGSSEQRVRGFQRGYEGGTLENCDTFNAAEP